MTTEEERNGEGSFNFPKSIREIYTLVSKVRFGLMPWLSGDPRFEKDWIEEVENLGFDSICVTDHLAGGLEAWTKLSALSTITNRARLGTIVLNAPLRNPVLLANMAATIDIISSGRLELGLGAGYVEQEFQACGIPFLEPKARIEQLEEVISIITELWEKGRLSFHGNYYRIEGAVCPKPHQEPRPPIMIGGKGERLLLKLAARYADIYNLPHTSLEETKHKLRVLKKHCLRTGRRFEEIEISWFGIAIVSKSQEELEKGVEALRKLAPERYPDPQIARQRAIIGMPEQCIERINEYAEAGISYFILYFPMKDEVRLFCREVLPRVRNLKIGKI
ncbi:LLM class flavin-dependent oxidoreductase [Candidatus Bathyarchaeota archaeon]|nr:LLM class flavin-dependent oxidoreductase [Candidatus Bathyarchaeota archaeon]